MLRVKSQALDQLWFCAEDLLDSRLESAELAAALERAKGQSEAHLESARGEKEAAIQRATGESEAIRLRGEAEAEAAACRVRALNEAGLTQEQIALRLIEEFPELVKGANVVLMPAEMSGIIGTATAALSAINSGRTLAEAKQAEVVVEPTGQQGDDQTKG